MSKTTDASYDPPREEGRRADSEARRQRTKRSRNELRPRRTPTQASIRPEPVILSFSRGPVEGEVPEEVKALDRSGAPPTQGAPLPAHRSGDREARAAAQLRVGQGVLRADLADRGDSLSTPGPADEPSPRKRSRRSPVVLGGSSGSRSAGGEQQYGYVPHIEPLVDRRRDPARKLDLPGWSSGITYRTLSIDPINGSCTQVVEFERWLQAACRLLEQRVGALHSGGEPDHRSRDLHQGSLLLRAGGLPARQHLHSKGLQGDLVLQRPSTPIGCAATAHRDEGRQEAERVHQRRTRTTRSAGSCR